ncbi:MAG: response regulator transcription factor [Oscillospiraceae bacterium]|nr:response regulator transcription factor [Oscillospiraceae bacterium]
MYNILICDDEKDIVNALKIYLTEENHTIFTAYNGKEALDVIHSNEIHLVLMDIMMPQMDGILTLSAIRQNYNIPVILLSAKSEDTDKILGLNMGADDYITKPFNPVELQARVKSRLRRYTKLGSKVIDDGKITIGGISMDDSTKTVTCDGEDVYLTPTEFEILRLFMHNPGKVFSPKEIYTKVWNDAPYGAENTVVVHIRHLREKLEINPAEPRYLKVVWGHGYKMENGK